MRETQIFHGINMYLRIGFWCFIASTTASLGDTESCAGPVIVAQVVD